MKSVNEIMSKDVEYCKQDDTLYDAAIKMKERNVGVIPICSDEKELLGVVTDRDLVLRGYAERKADTAKVQDVMSGELFSTSPNTDVQEASTLMAEKQIRRLPVVENGKLVGILSLGDLAIEHRSNEAAGKALEDISQRPELH